MAGIQERATAAAREFTGTVKDLTAATKADVNVIFDRHSSDFARINGVFFAIATPLTMLPLAAGEATRAFIKPPDNKP